MARPWHAPCSARLLQPRVAALPAAVPSHRLLAALPCAAGLWHGCPAAIKFMLAGGTENLSAQLTECMMCKALSHPNVVQTYTCNVRLARAHRRGA